MGKKTYKIGQSFPKSKFKFIGREAENGDRYFEVLHWFGFSFLPIRQFVVLELKNGKWDVVSVS